MGLGSGLRRWIAVLAVGSTCGLGIAHTGDHSLIDHVFEAYQEQHASGAKSASGSDAARQMGTLLSVVKDDQGRTVLPIGTTCDSVDITDGRLVARFTLPANYQPSSEYSFAARNQVMAASLQFLSPLSGVDDWSLF